MAFFAINAHTFPGYENELISGAQDDINATALEKRVPWKHPEHHFTTTEAILRAVKIKHIDKVDKEAGPEKPKWFGCAIAIVLWLLFMFLLLIWIGNLDEDGWLWKILTS